MGRGPVNRPAAGRHGAAWLLAAALAAWAALFLVTARTSIGAIGRVGYALDDPYIHMAISRNLAERGVFGFGADGFSAASSSPLWTFLLAGLFAVVGPHEWLPLALNAAGGAFVLCAAWRVGVQAGVGVPRLTALLAGVLLLTPLAPVAFTGLEHLFHTAAVLLMAGEFIAVLRAGDAAPRGALVRLWIWTAVATGLRYETLFLVAAAGVALLLRRRIAAAAGLGAAALIPVAAFGAFMISQGGEFLPNALLLKGRMPDAGSLRGLVRAAGYDAWVALPSNSHLLVLLLALLAGFAWLRHRADAALREADLLAVTAGTLLLHLQFAQTGWFYRYEGYLVALAWSALWIQPWWQGRVAAPAWSARIAVACAMLVALVPLAQRARAAHAETVRATINIHEQQYQMGRFLARFYSGASVAANDIGAVRWLADLRCLDLYGLATREVLHAKRRGAYTTESIRSLARSRGVRVAVLYEFWFVPPFALPEEWKVVGTWTIRDNVICSGETVSFLAADPAEFEPLRAHLNAFAAELPEDVTWTPREPPVAADDQR